MKRKVFIVVGLLGALAFSAKAADDFRTAALAAIRTAAPEVATENVRLLASPKLLAPLRGVTIRRSIFDPALDRWQLHLQCVPRDACIPSLAVIESSNKNLFEPTIRAVPTSQQVRVGEKKLLSVDIGSIRMNQAVVCLQSGRTGDQVRVRELNGRKILVATIQPDGSLSMGRVQ